MTSKLKPFDISISPSSTESVQIQFAPSTVTEVLYNDQMIVGTLKTDSKSSSNVTTLQNDFAVNSFVATKFYIVGNSSPSPNAQLSSFQKGTSKYLFDTKSAPAYAELVIEGIDMNENSAKMRICFLLFTNTTPTPGASSLTALLQSNVDNPVTTVDFGSAITSAFTSAKANPELQMKYVKYVKDQITYIVSTVPINVSATLYFNNNFNLGNYTTTYTVINVVDNETWMECDYVPLGMDQVTTMMQVPIGNVSDLDSEQSFRQIILFLVFLAFIVFFYFVIPPIYKMILWKVAENKQNEMCKVMKYFDWAILIIFSLLWFILGWVGVFSTDSNASNVLHAAIVIGVMHFITWGTIMTSKLNPNFPFDGAGDCDVEKTSANASKY
jgi:hypothetical protein